MDTGSDRGNRSRESLATRITNRAEEWLVDLNQRNHWLFRLYEKANEWWAALVFRGVRRRAAEVDREITGRRGTARIRFLRPEDLDEFAALLQSLDARHLPPHPLDRETAASVLRRPNYLPFGIYIDGELVGYELVRLFFPKRAVTAIWSLPVMHNRGLSAAAGIVTGAFTESEGLDDYITVPHDNVFSMKTARNAGWKVIRRNRRFLVMWRPPGGLASTGGAKGGGAGGSPPPGAE